MKETGGLKGYKAEVVKGRRRLRALPPYLISQTWMRKKKKDRQTEKKGKEDTFANRLAVRLIYD